MPRPSRPPEFGRIRAVFSAFGKQPDRQLIKKVEVSRHRFEIHDQVGPLFADFKGQAEHHALEPRGIGHSDEYGRVILFPYSGDGMSNGRRNLHHVVHDGVRALDEIDRVADGDMSQDREQLLENMAQRQEGHHLVCIVHRVVGGDGISHPDEVAVAEHGCLWEVQWSRMCI